MDGKEIAAVRACSTSTKGTATGQQTKKDSSASERAGRKNSNNKQECELKQQYCDNKPKQKQRQYNESKSAISIARVSPTPTGSARGDE
jgi:hypothetical protein